MMSNTGLPTYDSVDAARLLRAIGFEKGVVLNVTKVQKMLFMIYGYFLAKYNHRIFTEAPRAWPFGPVFPRTRDKIDYQKVQSISDPEVSKMLSDERLVDVTRKVVDTYSHFSAGKLSAWSHMPGTPWEKATQEKGFDWNDIIKDEYIRDYFNTETLIDE